MVDRAGEASGTVVLSPDRDPVSLAEQLHAAIPDMSMEELREVYHRAAVAERRAWEIQAHAIHEALMRATYGDRAAEMLAHDWSISRSRVYALAGAWELHREFTGREDILETLPEARWWTTAAAARTPSRPPQAWIERAAREHAADSGYSTHHLAADIRTRRHLDRLGSDERAAELRDETRRHVKERRGRPLMSLMVRGRRGPWGKATYTGSHSGSVLIDLWLHYGIPQRVLDPMEGSGTTGDVCRELGIEYHGYDLRHGFDSLRETIPGRFDFIFWHPPYWNLVDYDHGEGDLSHVDDYEEFLHQYEAGFRKFWRENLSPGGLFAVLIQDVQRTGRYRPICAETIMFARDHVEAVFVLSHGDYQSAIQAQEYADRQQRVPIVHEELVLFRRPIRGRGDLDDDDRVDEGDVEAEARAAEATDSGGAAVAPNGAGEVERRPRRGRPTRR